MGRKNTSTKTRIPLIVAASLYCLKHTMKSSQECVKDCNDFLQTNPIALIKINDDNDKFSNSKCYCCREHLPSEDQPNLPAMDDYYN